MPSRADTPSPNGRARDPRGAVTGTVAAVEQSAGASGLDPLAGGDGATDQPITMRDAPIGGQAVLEGVMMRGVSNWAVAIRKPDGEIAIETFPFTSKTKSHRFYRLPVVRGVVALVESLGIGMKALGISANHQVPEGEEEIGRGMWIGTVIFSLVFAVGLFFILPLGITSLFKSSLPNSIVFVLVEKAIRIAIFLIYLWAISRMKDLRRVFEFHGAEHKTIFNYEAGLPLAPAAAARFSRLHPRCGTSFLLLVMIVSIFVFVPLGTPAWYILFPSRVIGIPLVAGLAFEAIKWFGRNRDSAVARVLMWPGLQLQRLTTREPDAEQLAVAIAALNAVLALEDPRAAGADDRIGMEVVA